MELHKKRNAAYASFMRQMQDIEFGSAEATTTKDRVNISYPDGTRALLYVNSVKGGFGKGEFGLYIGLTISDGPIYQILKKTRLEGGSSFPKDMIFRTTSHSFKGARGLYAFRTATDVESTVTKMIRDVRKVYVPIIEQFTSRYEEAVSFIVDHNGEHVRKPFAMCVILLGLGNALSRLDSLIVKVKTVPRFLDFHRSKDYEHLIVERIRKWFAANKGVASVSRSKGTAARNRL
jgi:hypothetical protein